MKLAMSPALMAGLKQTAGAGAKLNLGALTRGPVLKSETGALQSAARKGLGGFNTMPPPAPIRALEVVRDPFAKAAMAACLDELMKLGAITDTQAEKSIDRLEALEKQAPTAGQVGRYGALGAGAGALGHVMSRAIEGGINRPTPRSALGAAASGALAMGAVPLVRGALDRRAERKTLKDYLSQEHVGEYGKNPIVETGSTEPPSGLSRAGFNV
jgi:hypothetical protein